MKASIIYEYAQQTDLNQILNLLEENDLPFEDVNLSKIKFIIAKKDNKIIGCVGLEPYGTEGLLRSFAVLESYRNQGVGNSLLQYLMSYSKQIDVINLHLLTVTAEKYFLSKGFVVSDRNTASASIKGTTEFSTICASSSTYMTYLNIAQTALVYSKNLYLTNFDKETQSEYWAISGKNLMFTYFEVKPNKTFEMHSHQSEQITHIIKGKLYFEVNGTTHELTKGDSIVIPSNIPHKVWTLEYSAKAVDSWSPVNDRFAKEREYI